MASSIREAFALAGVRISTESEPESRPNSDGSALGWRQRWGIRDFGISRHAAERYRERFGNAGDSIDAARDQLRARLDDGRVRFCRERPRWLVIVSKVGGQNAENSAGFLLVDDEMALPIRKGTSQSHPFYIVTCIARI